MAKQCAKIYVYSSRVDVLGIQTLKIKNNETYNMLAWPQNTRNPISQELNFKNFLGEEALDPLHGTTFGSVWSISNPLLLHHSLPQKLWFA